jgi:transcriptional antiterminator NusG
MSQPAAATNLSNTENFENDFLHSNVELPGIENSSDAEIEKSLLLGAFANQPRWYVIQTYVGFEIAAKRVLDQKIETLGLAEKILEIYIPTRKILKINTKGQKKEKEEIYHPGYIYLYMILDQETGYVIQNTQYISRIPGTGDVVVALESGVVEKIKNLLQLKADSEDPVLITNYKIGTPVNIVQGPFENHSGKICELSEETGKATISVSMFGRDTFVELDLTDISLMN